MVHESILSCDVRTASLIPVCQSETADTARAVMETLLHCDPHWYALWIRTSSLENKHSSAVPAYTLRV